MDRRRLRAVSCPAARRRYLRTESSVPSGIRVGDRFDTYVSLAGRFYCEVDATHQAIGPGDLLTRRFLLGYAMKASDNARAQGAILGKAMEGLEHRNKGEILVLVSLQ